MSVMEVVLDGFLETILETRIGRSQDSDGSAL